LIEVYFVAMRSKKMPLRGIDWSLTAGQEPTLHLLFIRQNGSSTAAAKFAALPDKIFYIPDLNHVHFPPAIPDDEDDDDLD
jgi:hypothetical protein